MDTRRNKFNQHTEWTCVGTCKSEQQKVTEYELRVFALNDSLYKANDK